MSPYPDPDAQLRECDPKLHAPFLMGLEEGVW